jgi:type 1 glutamine amidotransferase
MLALLLSLVVAQTEPINVLVFSKTAEFRHVSIGDGVRAIEAIGKQHGWNVIATEDSSRFTDNTLASIDVVVFLMTTGDVLDDAQQAAFERFIQSGKGYVGIHAAADTEYDWPWYGKLVGAYFKTHPKTQEATYIVEDRSHPATQHLPERWTRVDEHYTFHENPRAKVEVLMSLDETSFEAGEAAMGDHPVVWFHEFDGGRALYTALGHTEASYADENFKAHLAGAINWASGRQ